MDDQSHQEHESTQAAQAHEDNMQQLRAQARAMPTIDSQLPRHVGHLRVDTISVPCRDCHQPVAALRGIVEQEGPLRLRVNAVGDCPCGGMAMQDFRYIAQGGALHVEQRERGVLTRTPAAITLKTGRPWHRLPILPWASAALAVGVLAADHRLAYSLAVLLTGAGWTSGLLWQERTR